MVNDIHPHWQEDERTVIGTERPMAKKKAPVQARRHPAAILGIGVVLVAGFFAFGGQKLLSPFLAQVGTLPVGTTTEIPAVNANTVVIRITSTGMDPAAALISPGKSITWQNDSDLPHILTSETLREKDSELLLTDAIFPGTSTIVEVAPNQLPGAYTYTSQTARDLTGQIVLGFTQSSVSSTKSNSSVFGGVNDFSLFGDNKDLPSVVFASSSSIVSSAASSKITTFIPPVSSSAASAIGQVESSVPTKSSAPSSLSPLLAGFSLPKPSAPGDPTTATNSSSSAGSTTGVPINPYAVGSDRDHPYDELGNRLDGQDKTVLHSGAPFTPSTGQELWLAVILSLVIVAVGSSITMRKRKA